MWYKVKIINKINCLFWNRLTLLYINIQIQKREENRWISAILMNFRQFNNISIPSLTNCLRLGWKIRLNYRLILSARMCCMAGRLLSCLINLRPSTGKIISSIGKMFRIKSCRYTGLSVLTPTIPISTRWLLGY